MHLNPHIWIIFSQTQHPFGKIGRAGCSWDNNKKLLHACGDGAVGEILVEVETFPHFKKRTVNGSEGFSRLLAGFGKLNTTVHCSLPRGSGTRQVLALAHKEGLALWPTGAACCEEIWLAFFIKWQGESLSNQFSGTALSFPNNFRGLLPRWTCDLNTNDRI